MTKEELNRYVKQAGTKELTDAERAHLPDSFIALPCGNTHYEMKGEGTPVVLVPGYATPYYIYNKVFDALVAAGFRVLRYDLLGRGLSERTNTVYDPALFAQPFDHRFRILQSIKNNHCPRMQVVHQPLGLNICAPGRFDEGALKRYRFRDIFKMMSAQDPAQRRQRQLSQRDTLMHI